MPSQALEEKPAPTKASQRGKPPTLPGQPQAGPAEPPSTQPGRGRQLTHRFKPHPSLHPTCRSAHSIAAEPRRRLPADLEENTQTAYSVMLTVLISSLLGTEGCRVQCFPPLRPHLTPHPPESPYSAIKLHKPPWFSLSQHLLQTHTRSLYARDRRAEQASSTEEKIKTANSLPTDHL